MPTVATITPYVVAAPACTREGLRLSLQLARGAARAGGGDWQIEVVGYGPVDGCMTIENGVRLRTLPVDTPDQRHGRALSWGLLDALGEADIVHVYEPATRSGGLALALAVMRGHRVCVTDGLGEPPGPADAVEPAELAQLAIAPSAQAAARTTTRRPVRVVSAGVDTDFFGPGNGNRAGVVVAGPGAESVAEKLAAALPDGLRICGEPTEDAPGSGLGGAQCTARRVLFQRAAVTVHAGSELSTPEVVAVSLLEAMSCGSSVVGIPGAGLAPYVENGVSGFLVDDLPGLEAMVRRLLGDKPLRERTGRAARLRACSEWDLASAGQALLGVYSELLA